MNINRAREIPTDLARQSESIAIPSKEIATSSNKGPSQELVKEKFTEFVGQSLFGSMLATMRKSQNSPAYMHGGRMEQVFQQQLDQVIVEELTEASGSSIADPMFDLFNAPRRS